MSTSFITKDDIHGFWINDSILQVVCWGMMNAIDGHPDLPKKLSDEYRNHLFDCSQGYFVGFTNLRIDEYFNGDEGKVLFKAIIHDTERFFRGKGSSIPPEELNAFQLNKNSRRNWDRALDTVRLIKVLDYLKDLEDDKITITAGDEIIYSF